MIPIGNYAYSLIPLQLRVSAIVVESTPLEMLPVSSHFVTNKEVSLFKQTGC